MHLGPISFLRSVLRVDRLASRSSHAAKVLIRWGADWRIKNASKKSPLDIAEKSKDKSLLPAVKGYFAQAGSF